MVWMSTSVCALAKMVNSPPLLTFTVFHTSTIYIRIHEDNKHRQLSERLISVAV